MSKSKKSMSLSNICKNILMVCGTITALTGALGGVIETVSKLHVDNDNKTATVAESESESESNNDNIMMEQRIMLPRGGSGTGGTGGNVRISKTIELDSNINKGGGTVGGELGAGEIVPMPTATPTPTATEKSNIISSIASHISSLWGWILGAGILTVASIMFTGYFINRKAKTTDNSNEHTKGTI